MHFFQGLGQGLEFGVDSFQGVFQRVGQLMDGEELATGEGILGEHRFQLVVVFRKIAHGLLQGFGRQALEVIGALVGMRRAADREHCDEGRGREGFDNAGHDRISIRVDLEHNPD